MDVFLGFITPFPWNWPPMYWSACNGQVMSISQYNALFALLGTSFGGNGSSTFGLPELRGKKIIGYGQSPTTGTNYLFAAAGGAESVTLNPAQGPLAAHTHPATMSLSGLSGTTTLNASTQGGGTGTPVAGASLCAATTGPGTASIYVSPAPTTNLVALGNVSTTVSGSGTVTVNANTGSSASSPVPLMNPYLALNFCIALNGIFPSRN